MAIGHPLGATGKFLTVPYDSNCDVSNGSVIYEFALYHDNFVASLDIMINCHQLALNNYPFRSMKVYL